MWGMASSDSFFGERYLIFYTEYEAFRSDHPGDVNFAPVDGSVRSVSQEVDLPTLQAISTSPAEKLSTQTRIEPILFHPTLFRHRRGTNATL